MVRPSKYQGLLFLERDLPFLHRRVNLDIFCRKTKQENDLPQEVQDRKEGLCVLLDCLKISLSL